MSYAGNYPSSSGGGNGYAYPASTMGTTRPVLSAKMEEELSIAIKKALTPEELAPKQKHVRSCIVYTWDVKSSGAFWHAFKSYPLMGDEVVSLKGLILLHKVIRQGHPTVLVDAIREKQFLGDIAKNTMNSGRGYAMISRAYVDYLFVKLDFHRVHPDFSGTFDYEDYITLKGVEDPNEGYENIEELLGLLEKLDALQKFVFSNLRNSYHNEAKIAVLVPLVEESHGIYQFIVSMLTAMHKIIGSADSLSPLRQRFGSNHTAMYTFYHECAKIHYLTSLIAIPSLSKEAPNFLAVAPTIQPRNASPPRKQAVEENRGPSQAEINTLQDAANAERERQLQMQHQAYLLEQEQLRLQQQAEEAERQRQHLLMEQQQRLLEQQQQQYEFQQRELQKRQQEDYMRQIQQNAQSHLLGSLDSLKEQRVKDQDLIAQYGQRVQQLELQLQHMQLNAPTQQDKDRIRQLEEELQAWKTKYEALAKLYAQLRKEHLELLHKLKEQSNAALDVKKVSDAHAAEMKERNALVTQLQIDKTRLQTDLDRLALQALAEKESLAKQLASSKLELAEVSRLRGSETSGLLALFEGEKASLSAELSKCHATKSNLEKSVDDYRAQLARLDAETKETAAVLQSGLDQTLLALASQQKQARATSEELSLQLAASKARSTHLLDSLLAACSDGITQLSHEHSIGSLSSPPEYVLLLLDKAQADCSELGSALIKVIQNGGENSPDAVRIIHAFSRSLTNAIQHSCGLIHGQDEDETDVRTILNAVQSSIQDSKHFLDSAQSRVLDGIPDVAKRSQFILSLTKDTCHAFRKIAGGVESFKIRTSTTFQAVSGGDRDIDSEMATAASAIQMAASKLQDLLSSTSPELKVHSAILHAALAITTAIGNLLKYATLTQQEIVARGKGTSTAGQFYKKNHTWTEGLISSAKYVASSTSFLVESADALVSNNPPTASWEQLVVAAQEVSASTTQLVAASRVKADPYSKSLSGLESAAGDVRESTRMLVRAAKEASSAHQLAQHSTAPLPGGGKSAKALEIDQQVRILELEKELSLARFQLGEMRKRSYHADSGAAGDSSVEFE